MIVVYNIYIESIINTSKIMGNLCEVDEEKKRQREWADRERNMTTYSKNQMFEVRNTQYKKEKLS